MAMKPDKFSIAEHDWHSDEYVQEWIGRDIQRDEERRPLLRKMLSLAHFAGDSEIEVIDIGGGYGVVTEEVLKAFPHARVTLQDYSQPMLARARQRLAEHADRVEFLVCDLRDEFWSERVGRNFDLAVSAIAIHNLGDQSLIEQCYRSIYRILKPSGLFLDCDLFEYVDGVQKHLIALKESGFKIADCAWQQAPSAIIKARR